MMLNVWKSLDEEEEKLGANVWEDVSDTEEERVSEVIRSERYYGRESEKEKEKDKVKKSDKGKGKEDESEDVVVKQLKRTQAQVSVWDLLASSKKHREAMVEALSNLTISTVASPQDVTCLINDDKKGIIFTDADLPPKGRSHNKALFIKVEMKGKRALCVMVDDGSSFNVCPLKALPKFGMDTADLEASNVIIRAYDDSKRPVAGTFKAMVKTGPIQSKVEFIVIDIPMTFALLLGKPWFHTLGGVLTTLHQKVKFPTKDGVVTICAESNDIVAALNV